MEIICATGNKDKAAEIAEVLTQDGHRVRTAGEAGIELNVVEDGATFEENAVKKAVAAVRVCGVTAMSDDSGLEVYALDGKPGVRSARFLGEETPYSEKNRQMLEMLHGAQDRRARFRCVIAVAFTDGRVLTTEGVLEGEIALTPEGGGGFGYDPIFFVPEYQMTLAQMTPGLKHAISHRGQALEKMKALLAEVESAEGTTDIKA